MEIFVASTSPHKIAATREAAVIAYPGTLHVVGYKAASEINEQPVGQAETLLGANNRMRNLKVMIGGTRYDVLIAMENGINEIPSDQGGIWMDTGLVIAEDMNGRRGIAQCIGVPFETMDVDEARRNGFETTTVGSVYAKRKGTEATDPHRGLTNGLVTRMEGLKQAVLAAIGQLQRMETEQ